ncbi:MAG TPA: protein-L-isoaspartate(D-aspartate) O-methyltransferase [Actinomycetota bacterium]|nr:protein-L-isoaspartate(D-aspartate) O-methyltransferase [Actinomycetota bacterium]
MPSSQEGLARLVERESLVDLRIVDAFRAVDRARFVPAHAAADAYLDRPIGIPEEQTTSQPSLIARMLDAAAPRAGDRALEVGTGYGFQTALLSRLVDDVVSIERWPALADAARANLDAAGVRNVEVVVGDGWRGVPDRAPFDVVVVSAAADEVPAALGDQLADGGRLVIPVRARLSDRVYLYVKEGARLRRRRLVSPARFVPLVRGDDG